MKKLSVVTGFLVAFVLPAVALAAQAQVSLGTNSISPSTVVVNAGDTVVWTNTSNTSQSVTGDNGTFQSGPIAPGAQFAASFTSTGTYNYYDNAGGGAILGQVDVGAAVSAPTTQTTSSTYVNPNYNFNASASTASNESAASLTAEIQTLIAEIDALEGKSSTSGSVSGAPSYVAGGSCPQIGRVLSIGSSGSDVTSLQQFLGVSPATGYYGTITQAAVESWQAANNIISYGTPATTGYGVVGPRTEAAIRLSCSGGSGSSSSGSGTNNGVVSGYLQVSPISGAAPLVVTVVATVNTAASCTGATYNLDFGDGTQDQQMNVPSGTCSQQNQSFQHTYQSGGTFTITLSSGSHSSTATVTVSGQSATTSVTATGSDSQASGSMTAFITSGPAPLATTFYISCASGLAYDVVYGDGSDLGSNGVAQSSCNGGLQSVAHTYTAVGSYNAQLVVFTRNAAGTVSSQSVAEQGITVTGPSTTSTTGSTTLQPPTLTPDVGGNPLAVSMQFNANTCSNAYNITWGDTGISTSPTNNTNSSGCTAVQTFTVPHTYTAAGTYSVTLTRATASGSTQTNTVGVSISN